MKKLWKIYRFVAIGFFSLLLLDFATVAFFAWYRPAVQKSDAIIILGAAINTPALYNRSLEGLRMYREGKAGILVLSGGRVNTTDLSEAGYMLKVIKKNSPTAVPALLEDKSHNTYENIQDSKKMLPGASSVIIVSDTYHLARGVLLAKRAGFKKVYWAAPSPSFYKTSELAFYYIREMAAMIEYIPKFIFG